MSAKSPGPGMVAWPVVVECPSCHRPLFPLGWDGVNASIGARVIEAENGDTGGTFNVLHGWSARHVRVLSVEPGFTPGITRGGGRFRIICEAPRQRRPVQREVTQAALDDTMRRALVAGESRVLLTDIRADSMRR